MSITKSFIEKRYASKVIYENFIIVLKNEIIIKDNSLSDLFSYNSRDIFTNSTSSYTSSNPDGVVV